MMRAVLAAAVATVSLVPAGVLAEDKPADEAEDKPADEAEAEAKTKPAGDVEEDTEVAEVAASGPAKGRMTLPGGKVLFDVIVETNLAKGVTLKPISVAPDLWIGVADRLTFGIVHSGRATTGFLTGSGRGLCFNGGADKGVCAAGLGKIYTSGGAQARIGLLEGGFALALDLGVHAFAFKPKVVLAGKGGFIGRFQAGGFALELAPSIFAGLTQRTIDMGGVKVSNNEERVAVPVTALIMLTSGFAIALQSGVTFPLKQAGDNWQVPAAAGLALRVGSRVSIDVAFGLDAALDTNDATKPFDARSLTLGVGYGL